MFPLEIVTLLGSGLMSAVMSIWSMKLKAQQANWEMALKVGKHNRAAVDDARKHSSPGFQFTRRLLALSAVFAVIVLPKLAAVFRPEIAVTVGYTEFRPGFLFFTDGRDVINWVVAEGLTITPLDTHFVMAVAGLYFGASITKNS